MEDSSLSGLVRVGTVTSVNASKLMCRVKFEDQGFTSGWLKVLQHSGCGLSITEDTHSHSCYPGSTSSYTHNHPKSVTTTWMPSIGSAVLCLYLPMFNGDGYVLGGIT